MRIAILSRTQGKVNRGVESFVDELSKYLSEKNDVEVLSGVVADNLRAIVKGHYDIVMPMNGRMQSLKASLGKHFGGYKVVIGGHSGIGRDDIWNIAVAKPDVFVALTDFMASWAKRWAWGIKVVKIPNGVNLKKFSPKGDKIQTGLKAPVVLSVGALVWYKHHEKVIDAVANLADASLLIVGSGEDEEKLKSLGQKKLGERFKIMKVPYEQMPRLYRSADLFTLPSWDREAFGLVYLEAMASGLAVVAPDDLPRKEIVGDGGIFVDVDNSQEYAGVIRRALDVDWQDRPRKQAEKFSLDKMVSEYEKLFEKLIKR